MGDEVSYGDSAWIFDVNKLRYDLENVDSGMLEIYLSDNFEEECSRLFQRHEMLQHPFFGRKILEDWDLENSEKQSIFLRSLVYGDSGQGRIVLVDGAMGGGKTGFGCWVIDQYHQMQPKLRFFFVTKSDSRPQLPKWINIVDNVNKIENNSIALIDEGAIQLSSRKSTHKENKDTSELLVQLRQKGITMILLVQHVKMIDVNVRRLANIRCLKYGIDFGTDDNNNDDLKLIRQRLRPKSNREVYVEIPAKKKFMKIGHGLPVWWDDEKVSKYMKGWKKEPQVSISDNVVAQVRENLNVDARMEKY